MLIADSSDIVAYVDRTFAGDSLDTAREAGALDRDFSIELGPHARRIVYHHLLDAPELLDELARRNVSPLQAAVFRSIRGFVARSIRRTLQINAKGAARSEEKTRATADAVAERLADGRPYCLSHLLCAAATHSPSRPYGADQSKPASESQVRSLHSPPPGQ